jgi:hypothetical protein
MCNAWPILQKQVRPLQYIICLCQRVLNDLKRTRLSHRHMIWFLLHPPPPSPVSMHDQRHRGRLRKRDNLLMGGGGGDGGGAKPYDSGKVWSSINHSIFSLPGLAVFILAQTECTYTLYRVQYYVLLFHL